MRILTITDLHLGQREKCFGVNPGQLSLLAKPATADDAYRRHGWLASVCAELSARGAGAPGPVELVVTGDLLDLSLARLDVAVDDLGHLLGTLPEVDRLTWVVGNHDHHVWTLHTEHERVLAPMARGAHPDPTPLLATPPDEPSPAPWLGEAVSAIARRRVEVRLAYPVYRRVVAGPDGRPTHLVFTHGHTFGGLSSFMGSIFGKRARETSGRPDVDAAVVIAPFVEFVYWALGRAGHGLGGEGFMEHLYTDIQRGDRRLLDELGRDLADTIGKHVDPDSRQLATALRWLARFGAGRIAGAHQGSGDRHLPVEATRRALRANLPAAGVDPDAPTLLFFGHTHQGDRFEVGRAVAYNLGTWLLEPGHPLPEPIVAAVYAPDGARPDLRLHYGGIQEAPPQLCSRVPFGGPA